MRKVALVFMLAVVLPSLVLAGLAWRSLRDQQFVLERQQAWLFQGACDSAATQIRELMRAQEGGFVHAVDTLLEDQDVRQIALTFDKRIRTSWPNAETGFAVTLDGNILAPASFESDSAAKFRRDYELFLSNRVAAEVYPSQWNANNLASGQQVNVSPERFAMNRTEEPPPPAPSPSTTISLPPETPESNAPPPQNLTLAANTPPVPEPVIITPSDVERESGAASADKMSQTAPSTPAPAPPLPAEAAPAQNKDKDKDKDKGKVIENQREKKQQVDDSNDKQETRLHAADKEADVSKKALEKAQERAQTKNENTPTSVPSVALRPSAAPAPSSGALPAATSSPAKSKTHKAGPGSTVPAGSAPISAPGSAAVPASPASADSEPLSAQEPGSGSFEVPPPVSTAIRPGSRSFSITPYPRNQSGRASASSKATTVQTDSATPSSTPQGGSSQPAAAAGPVTAPSVPLPAAPTAPPSPIAQLPDSPLSSGEVQQQELTSPTYRSRSQTGYLSTPSPTLPSSQSQSILQQQMPAPQRAGESQIQLNDFNRSGTFNGNNANLNEPEHLSQSSYTQTGNRDNNINSGNNYLNLKRSQFNIPRKVKPVKDLDESPPPNSKFAPAEAEFRQLIGSESSGAVALFMQNRLSVLVWYRSPRDPQLVFGAKLAMPVITAAVATGLSVDKELAPQICLAVLDASGRPVARTAPWFETSNWKRPFVATEVGEVLPHWEVAAYLLDPAEMNRAASNLHGTVASLISLMLMAIAVGGWLIAVDLRRQLVQASQKTDFVSNVSHELKTPLTSIRMFSELLQGHRADDPIKRTQFAQIISTEAARLTRLINNVLDFSRMERGEKIYQMEPCDLAQLLSKLMAGYGPQLTSAGYTIKLDLPAVADASDMSASDNALVSSTVPVYGDADALTQVILNLVSNAEKYGGIARDIYIELKIERFSSAKAGTSPGEAVLRVMDRGPGVPTGAEKAIFEQFYRAHDALNSGIQGSGLGLTLSQQIARAHQGDVTYRQRPGGGSIFTLRLPLSGRVGVAPGPGLALSDSAQSASTLSL